MFAWVQRYNGILGLGKTNQPYRNLFSTPSLNIAKASTYSSWRGFDFAMIAAAKFG